MLNREWRDDILFRIFSNTPVSVLESFTRRDLLLPYYHIVGDDDIPHVKHLYKYKTAAQFKEDIDFLLKKYVPVGVAELLGHVRSGRPLPKNAFLLTFDDGYREIGEIVAQILLQKGVSATFFVNSAFIDNKAMCYLNKASLVIGECQKNWSTRLEQRLSGILHSNRSGIADVRCRILTIKYHERSLLDEIGDVMEIDFDEYLKTKRPYLSSDQINRLIECGFTIGGHSIDHPLYASLSLDEQLRQTIESVEFVRKTFNVNYGVFAFPHSDRNVSSMFFSKLTQSGLVDLSFGTAGLMDDGAPNNLQRFSLEKPTAPADRIIAFQYARRLTKLVTRDARLLRK